MPQVRGGDIEQVIGKTIETGEARLLGGGSIQTIVHAD